MPDTDVLMPNIADQSTKVTLYFREQGPVCYEAPSISRATLIEQLLSSDLGWCWESRRDPTDDTYDNPCLPSVRPLTLLTPEASSLSSAELKERNADGYGRWVHIFGCLEDEVEGLLAADELPRALTAFSAREEGPIRIFVFIENDSPYDYIFVPHEPFSAVSRLLKAWNIELGARYKTRPYKKLYTVTLESIFRLAGPEKTSKTQN